jgi:SAM-dependent methyltransferase
MAFNPIQYDAIGTKYDRIKQTPFNKFERHNFEKHVRRLINGRDVTAIDFACGTGFYSHVLLQWGVKSLTGVDISTAMLQGAKARLSQTEYATQAKFIHGDGCQPQLYTEPGSGGFDVAIGVWFLPYACDFERLTNMFKSISLNLNSGGVFVGVCNYGADDVPAYAKSFDDTAEARAKLSITITYGDELDNKQGCLHDVHTTNVPGGMVWPEEIRFTAYHLKKSIYEEAARAGGLKGRMEWHPCEVLDSWRAQIGFEDDPEGWKQLQDVPLLSILVVYKE